MEQRRPELLLDLGIGNVLPVHGCARIAGCVGQCPGICTPLCDTGRLLKALHGARLCLLRVGGDTGTVPGGWGRGADLCGGYDGVAWIALWNARARLHSIRSGHGHPLNFRPPYWTRALCG